MGLLAVPVSDPEVDLPVGTRVLRDLPHRGVMIWRTTPWTVYGMTSSAEWITF
jgi:hypothetical protein